MKAQFFIISSVIMIYVIVLTFQYLTGFSDIRLSGIEEHQELSYIKNIKNSFIQTLSTSNYSNSGDLNKVAKDIDFAKNFFRQEMLKKGIDFDSKFIFFSNGFESNDLSDWSGVYGVSQILNGTAYNGINSLYSNAIEYVTKNLSGVSEVYVRTYVNFNALPSNSNEYYFMDLYENSNQVLGLGLENENEAYKLIVYSSFSGPWISPAINIDNGEWHYFELYWFENGTNSILKIWYDGQLEIVSQAIASGGKGKLINQYNFGGANAVGGTPDLYVDCVAVSSDYVGDKCYPDEQNYFDFTLKTNGMHTETEFPYQEKIVPNPIWFNNFVNNTLAGQPTLFSLNWTDVVGLSGYIFSFDNCTGSLVNDTAWVPMTGLNNWSSAIKAISPIVGCTIRWQVYANDTSGKWNTSYIFSLTTTGTPLLIQFVSPTDNNGATVSRNWSYVNVSITDASSTSSFIDWNRSLIGYWSMDWYNSTGVFDNSTWNNFGTFQNGLGTDNITSGQYGRGLNFDGSNDYVNCGNNPSLYQTPNNQWTIEVWVYPKSLDGLRDIFRKEASGNGYYLRNNAGGIQSLLHFSDGSYTERLGGSFTLNQWQHVVMTYNGSERKHFKNGVEVGSWTEGKNLQFDASSNVALGSGIGGEYWNGTIDEVRIYNRVLSPEEIKASYNSGLYNLYHNFTNLTSGVYQYYAYAIDINGNANKTETRTITLSSFNGNLWLKFNEASGTRAFDSSLYGNDGTYYGETFNDGTSYNGSSPTDLHTTSGKYGSALSFDGLNDYVDVANSNDLNKPNSTNQITVEGWIKLSNLSSIIHTIAFKGSDEHHGFWLGPDLRSGTPHSVWWEIGDGTGAFINCNPGFNFAINNWYHIAGTYDGSSMKVYINGTLQITCAPNVKMIFDTADLFISRGLYSWGYVNGSLDDVRIYDRALSLAEIQKDVNSSLPISRPVASYSFEESGSYVNDTHVWVNGTYGSALSFDGADDYVNIPYSTSLNISNEITAAVWIKPANVTACPENYGQTIIANSLQQYQYNYWFYLCNGNLGLTAYSTTYPLLTTSNVIPTSNIWYHLAFTAKKGGAMNIYVNGNPIANGNADTNFLEGGGVTIGDLRPGRGLRFNGTIDEVRIWNRTLSAEEIWAEMNKD